jgi:flagellin
VPGQSLATINVTTSTGASDAQLIVAEAINQVNQYQAQLGSFQSNVLQTNTSFLNSSIQNMTSEISSLTAANIPQQSANLTSLQAIQQSAVAALQTAQGIPSLYLKLLP